MKMPEMPWYYEMLTSTAKMTTWISPLKNWPLYMAPTPGIRPSTAAAAGLGPLVGAANGCWKVCHAVEQGSQRTCPPATLRTQPAQSALPQFWHQAVAGTPL